MRNRTYGDRRAAAIVAEVQAGATWPEIARKFVYVDANQAYKTTQRMLRRRGLRLCRDEEGVYLEPVA